ncbi:MAG: 2,3-bisphosphoglycerate-independent phosphoglycerate mutase [Alphaproteobacteria bacterium]
MTTVLCILDGWGYSEKEEGNAIFHAQTPHWDRLMVENPHTFLRTDGEAVGLPVGQMGNSEVGHMNIGAGRVVLQNLPRINRAFKDGDVAKSPAILKLIDTLKITGKSCHLMGLLSDGGVHAHQDHIIQLTKILSDTGIPVILHAFLDGRDTPPRSAAQYVHSLEASLENIENATLKTLTGRYFAMDRDQRWDRVEQAYNAIVLGNGRSVSSGAAAVETAYAADENDEFVSPSIVEGYQGMEDGDALIMANFRADRAREILSALVDPNFEGFARQKIISFADAIGFVKYSESLDPFLKTLFAPSEIKNGLGELLAEKKLKQLRLAETEKYAHVTFFFNGGNETEYAGEDRILVPSPAVRTYDLKPEMAAQDVTDHLVSAIEKGAHDLIVVNYANPDMVGHTGVFDAVIQAIETIDNCLGQVLTAVKKTDASLFITADHGNAEQIVNYETGAAHTAHSCNVVPFVFLGSGAQKNVVLKDGCLADIAPTILTLMQVPQPIEMTGKSLLD